MLPIRCLIKNFNEDPPVLEVNSGSVVGDEQDCPFLVFRFAPSFENLVGVDPAEFVGVRRESVWKEICTHYRFPGDTKLSSAAIVAIRRWVARCSPDRR
ncbi:MAG: hypothetical protein OXI81_00210 [Paracoccaceae bacterium]|nr:hypothetical protein [Paracoccaceae bacterium]